MECPTCGKSGYAKEPGYHCVNCGTYESVHADQCKVPKLVPAVALLLDAVDGLLSNMPEDDESARQSSLTLVFYCVETMRNIRRILSGK